MATSILAYTGFCAYFAYRMTAEELKHLSELGNVVRQIELR